VCHSKIPRPMSELAHKPRRAQCPYRRIEPLADISGAAIYSMTESARSRNDSGIANPSALAVLRLTTSLN